MLAEASAEQIPKLILVWGARWIELHNAQCVKGAFIRENKHEKSVPTAAHPHALIYAYPFTPPCAQREIDMAKAYWLKTGRCLVCWMSEEEGREGERMIVENDSFIAFVPLFARWPYEVHVVARRHCQSMDRLSEQEARDFTSILKSVLSGYERLFGVSFPSMFAIHQEPAAMQNSDYHHFHIEFHPPVHSARRPSGLETSSVPAVNDLECERHIQRYLSVRGRLG
jgi:UDPglucose--hexose-1-phosphate uridylyltransferase